MKQYCRYCCNAVAYYDDGFVCEAESPCGNNGAGKWYTESKAKRPNKCPRFEFNENDLFGLCENGYRKYRPRAEKDYEQIKMEIPK